MALSLSAEQKSIVKLFKIEEQYIVPSYQRPYSWEYDQCNQLYTDLYRSYINSEDYFLGNIIIAKSENNKESLEVVDGQQRLITLILFIKVLSYFQDDLIILNQLIMLEDWKGENKMPRIKSDIFESKDNEWLHKALNYSREDIIILLEKSVDKNGRIVERKIDNKFTLNMLFFYQWISFFVNKDDNIESFTYYLLRNVFLLPIELGGKTQDEANEKALIIFETINNRGMNLEDADIFKAKLYNKAKKVKEEDLFIDSWKEFKAYCDILGIRIDDVFRSYSHIIRGKNNITTGEKNLREFFTREEYSPFELMNYKEIVEELFSILEIISFVNNQKNDNTIITPWLQVLDLYTNQYPKYAIYNYLFINGIEVSKEFEIFLKSLIRYVFYQGSTSTVKFEIYNIIKHVSLKKDIDNYAKHDIAIEYFDYLGRLKKGFTLLSYYLDNGKVLDSIMIERIVSPKDEKIILSIDNNIEIKNMVDNIANYVVLSTSIRNLPFERRTAYLIDNNMSSVDSKNVLEAFTQREIKLKKLLVAFFSTSNE